MSDIKSPSSSPKFIRSDEYDLVMAIVPALVSSIGLPADRQVDIARKVRELLLDGRLPYGVATD